MLNPLLNVQVRLQVLNGSSSSPVSDPDAYSIESDPPLFIDSESEARAEGQEKREVGIAVCDAYLFLVPITYFLFIAAMHVRCSSNTSSTPT